MYYNILKDNEILYAVILDGSMIKNIYGDIDLSMNFNEIEGITKTEFKDKNLININTNYKGQFPEGMMIKIPNNNHNKDYQDHEEHL